MNPRYTAEEIADGDQIITVIHNSIINNSKKIMWLIDSMKMKWCRDRQYNQTSKKSTLIWT